MFKYAHFYTFPFNLIIDPRSLNKPLLFEYNDIQIRLKSPYKSYPYNHDFSYKPLFYINNKGQKVQLPISSGWGAYPMYTSSNEHIGMIIQQENEFNFNNSTKLTLAENVIIPNTFNYTPVDTIRFDSNKKFNNDTPKFLSTFFSHLRILSEQFWINKPRADSEEVSLEANIKFDENLDNFQSHSNLIPIIRYNKGVPITYEIWENAIENTINQIDVDFARSLYLDAIYERTTTNNRSVVLSLANSMDIRVNTLFRKISKNEAGFDRHKFVVKHREHKKVSSTYIPGLISEFLKPIINRDYKAEHPEEYKTISDFWLNSRNTVAHGSNVDITDDEIIVLFSAVGNVLEWLEDIEKTYANN